MVAQLASALDDAWRQTAAGLPTNPQLRIEHHDGQDRTVASPLDTIEKRASLPELRSVVESMLPEIEIADVPPRGLWLDRVPR